MSVGRNELIKSTGGRLLAL